MRGLQREPSGEARARASARLALPYPHELRQHDLVVVVLVLVDGFQAQEVLVLGVAGLASGHLEPLAHLVELLRRDGAAHNLAQGARGGFHGLVILGLQAFVLLGTLIIQLLELRIGATRTVVRDPAQRRPW